MCSSSPSRTAASAQAAPALHVVSLDLPEDILWTIAELLHYDSLYNLVLVSHQCHHAFQPHLEKRRALHEKYSTVQIATRCCSGPWHTRPAEGHYLHPASLLNDIARHPEISEYVTTLQLCSSITERHAPDASSVPPSYIELSADPLKATGYWRALVPWLSEEFLNYFLIQRSATYWHDATTLLLLSLPKLQHLHVEGVWAHRFERVSLRLSYILNSELNTGNRLFPGEPFSKLSHLTVVNSQHAQAPFDPAVPLAPYAYFHHLKEIDCIQEHELNRWYPSWSGTAHDCTAVFQSLKHIRLHAGEICHSDLIAFLRPLANLETCSYAYTEMCLAEHAQQDCRKAWLTPRCWKESEEHLRAYEWQGTLMSSDGQGTNSILLRRIHHRQTRDRRPIPFRGAYCAQS